MSLSLAKHLWIGCWFLSLDLYIGHMVCELRVHMKHWNKLRLIEHWNLHRHWNSHRHAPIDMCPHTGGQDLKAQLGLQLDKSWQRKWVSLKKDVCNHVCNTSVNPWGAGSEWGGSELCGLEVGQKIGDFECCCLWGLMNVLEWAKQWILNSLALRAHSY